MRILIMAQHYAPEEVSGAVLATELAESLVQRGHEVVFVTSAPHYPQGRVFPGYHNRLWASEVLAGVRIIRTWSYISPRKDFLSRALNFGTFSLSAFFGGLSVGKADVILSYSPPLPLGLSAWLLSRLRSALWVLRVEDLYPEAAVAAGMLKSRAAICLFEWLERFLYRRADHISLISEGFRCNLLAKSVPAQKLSVIPVWADPNQVRPLPKENDFRRQHGLEGKFVILYAGAMGLTSALEDVLVAAEYLKGEKSIHFLFVGEGVKKPDLERTCQERGLSNVSFLPFQPRARYAEMLAAADLSLVTLNSKSAQFSMPNKVFNIMASGRPILAVAPLDSEVAELVQRWECGINVPPQNPEALAQMIQSLSQDGSRLQRLGNNGRKALEGHYSRQQCIEAFESLFLRMVT